MSRGHLTEILTGRSVATDMFLDVLFLEVRQWPIEISEEKDKRFKQAQERIRELAAAARIAKRQAAANRRTAERAV